MIKDHTADKNKIMSLYDEFVRLSVAVVFNAKYEQNYVDTIDEINHAYFNIVLNNSDYTPDLTVDELIKLTRHPFSTIEIKLEGNKDKDKILELLHAYHNKRVEYRDNSATLFAYLLSEYVKITRDNYHLITENLNGNVWKLSYMISRMTVNTMLERNNELTIYTIDDNDLIALNDMHDYLKENLILKQAWLYFFQSLKNRFNFEYEENESQLDNSLEELQQTTIILKDMIEKTNDDAIINKFKQVFKIIDLIGTKPTYHAEIEELEDQFNTLVLNGALIDASNATEIRAYLKETVGSYIDALKDIVSR